MMKKEEILSKLEGVDEGEFILRTEAEENEFRDNLLKTELDKRIGDRIKEVHTSYDNDIFAATGKKKKEDEKTYDFLKRTLSEYKEKTDSIPLLEGQIKELNAKMRDGSGDETLKNQLKNLEKKHSEALQNWTTEKDTILKTHNNELVGAELDKEISKLKFRNDIPQAVIDSYVSTVRNEMLNKALRQDGRLVFKNGEDGILTDNTTLKPIGADVILSDKLKDILGTEGKGGLGGGKDSKSETGEIVPPDSALQSKDALSKYLLDEFAKRGLSRNEARNSKEYVEAFKTYSEKIA